MNGFHITLYKSNQKGFVLQTKCARFQAFPEV